MDKTLERRIVNMTDNIEDVQNKAQQILKGITEWTSHDQDVQLKLLGPRLINLVSNIDMYIEDIDCYIKELNDCEGSKVTINMLLQQKGILLNTRRVMTDIQENIDTSLMLIDNSNKVREAKEYIQRCQNLKRLAKEMYEKKQ